MSRAMQVKVVSGETGTHCNEYGCLNDADIYINIRDNITRLCREHAEDLRTRLSVATAWL